MYEAKAVAGARLSLQLVAQVQLFLGWASAFEGAACGLTPRSTGRPSAAGELER
jgi:hypothetical protein